MQLSNSSNWNARFMANNLYNLTPYELGELGTPDALPVLRIYLSSHKVNDVRLAASAISKIANHYPDDCRPFVPDLIRALNTNKSQVIQYAIGALIKIPFTPNDNDLSIFAAISKSHGVLITREQAGYLVNPHGKTLPMPVIPGSSAACNKPAFDTPSLNLTGEQRRMLTLPPNNPILIRGVAGSGKTTLAIMRAKQLAASDDDLYRQTSIHIFSYSKSLVKYIESMLGSAISNPLSKISVSTLHSWMWHFLKNSGIFEKYKIAEDGAPEKIFCGIIESSIAKHPNNNLFKKSPTFFIQEIRWIKGSGLLERQDYLDRARTGRGTSDRVTGEDKDLIWTTYQEYLKRMQDNALIDFDDFVLHALKIIDSSSDFKPPFSHIVIDEAQDLTASQIRLMTQLVSLETKSITLIADAAQRIYKSGFSWLSVGIDIRGGGRSIELKHNYRNSRQIAEAALSLLSKDPQQEDFTSQIAPTRIGPLPTLVYASSQNNQLQYILTLIGKIDLENSCITVLHRTLSGCETLVAGLREHGVYPQVINSRTNNQIHAVGVYICTMTSIKGLECDHVVIADVNDNLIPLRAGFVEEGDELQINTERRLLYTCMTRAKSTLTMIVSGKPSRYLSEINQANVDVLHI